MTANIQIYRSGAIQQPFGFRRQIIWIILANLFQASYHPMEVTNPFGFDPNLLRHIAKERSNSFDLFPEHIAFSPL